VIIDINQQGARVRTVERADGMSNGGHVPF
jgi:hypothetical protein